MSETLLETLNRLFKDAPNTAETNNKILATAMSFQPERRNDLIYCCESCGGTGMSKYNERLQRTYTTPCSNCSGEGFV